ncbi:MAG: G-D-S-L family lipolytic protein [Gammaproteobacteria bacterium]|nr:G-D-S-L family lipolytic protein [Gammaproteobacteria bacterium]
MAKTRAINLIGIAFICSTLVACKPDFSNFVAVGDSLTAGFADGALYQDGQLNSYPSILSTQFSKLDSASFSQPLMSDNLGGLLFGGNSHPSYPTRLVLNTTTGAPETLFGAPSTEVYNVINGPFNNMGVPGAKSFHLISTDYGDPAGLSMDPATANPYFVRFASWVNTSIVADAASQNPSFFVLWVGNNDVLSYATGGGVGIDQLGNADTSTYAHDDITDPGVFVEAYSSTLDSLSASGGSGALINIPDVSAIPFFTTVTYNAIPMDQEGADLANSGYTAYNAGIEAAYNAGAITLEELQRRTIAFSAGQNPVVINDEYLSDLTARALPSYRQATSNELLLLTTGAILGNAVSNSDSRLWGISAPLEDKHILVADEINLIETARLSYNQTIKELVKNNYQLVYVDAAALLEALKSGIDYGSGSITSAYITGGAFSLDGVHLTARGYAVLSNKIIDAINIGFGADIEKVDPGGYPTIYFK